MKNAQEVAKLVHEKYDALLATQLKLIAEERGVTVEELCFCYSINIAQQNMYGGYFRFWIEVK